MPEHATDRALSRARHETRDITVRFMAIFLGGIGCTLLALMLLAYEIYPGEVKDGRFAEPFPNFPNPRLQPSPAVDWQTFYHAEMAQLNSAGWQDRAAGALHIPVDQAMRAIAAEGIKGWPTGNTTVSEGNRR